MIIKDGVFCSTAEMLDDAANANLTFLNCTHGQEVGKENGERERCWGY